MSDLNRYGSIIQEIFLSRHKAGDCEVQFQRSDIERAAAKLGIELPKNIGDIPYTFRYRATLPDSIRRLAPKGREWVIMGAGRSRYAFVAMQVTEVTPGTMLAETKIPDATPGIISMYALNDEQALLAKLRYNRLVDIFTGVTCYSLQSHLRTTVKQFGQVETDEMYVGIDRKGAQYVFPVQAKGGKDRMSVVQIAQDMAVCAKKFPDLICRPIGAQFMKDHVIALFEFEEGDTGVVISAEKHYRLVLPDQLSKEELKAYQQRQP